MPDISTMDLEQLKAVASDYDIDFTDMSEDEIRAAIIEAENSVDTSEEDEFEAGMAQELAAREAAQRRAEGHDVDENQHPMLAKSRPQAAQKPVKPRAPSGSSNGLKIEADRPERNGVKRPSAGGKCRGIWDMLDEIGSDATAKQARDTGIPMGFDKTTIMVQYYRWRKFNGIGGRQS